MKFSLLLNSFVGIKHWEPKIIKKYKFLPGYILRVRTILPSFQESGGGAEARPHLKAEKKKLPSKYKAKHSQNEWHVGRQLWKEYKSVTNLLQNVLCYTHPHIKFENWGEMISTWYLHKHFAFTGVFSCGSSPEGSFLLCQCSLISINGYNQNLCLYHN